PTSSSLAPHPCKSLAAPSVLGFGLSRKGVIQPEGSKTIATVLVWLCYPCLLFSNVVIAIGNPDNPDAMYSFGTMTIASIINICIGLAIGNAVLWAVRSPIGFRYGTVLAVTMGNHGDVAMAIILSVASRAPFDSGDSTVGIAFVSAFLFFTNIFVFSAGYTFFGEDYKMLEAAVDEECDGDALMQDPASKVPFPNGSGASSTPGLTAVDDLVVTPASTTALPSPIDAKGAASNAMGPGVRRTNSTNAADARPATTTPHTIAAPPSANPRPSVGALHLGRARRGTSFSTYTAPPRGIGLPNLPVHVLRQQFSRASFCSVPPETGTEDLGGVRASTHRASFIQVSVGGGGGGGIVVGPARQVELPDTAGGAAYVSGDADAAGRFSTTSAGPVGRRPGWWAPVRRWLDGIPVLVKLREKLQTPSSQKVLFWVRSLMNLANMSSLLGLFVGSVPALRRLFQPSSSSEQPPLLFVFEIFTLIGATAVPFSLLNLGAALGRLNFGTMLPARVIAAITFARLVVMPAIGIGLLEACVPTGSSTVFFTQLWHPQGEANMISSVIIVEYTCALVSLTFWLSVILYVISSS
ncbi:auxin efflux carrier, partial [Zopfochytrium polystomum]